MLPARGFVFPAFEPLGVILAFVSLAGLKKSGYGSGEEARRALLGMVSELRGLQV